MVRDPLLVRWRCWREDTVEQVTPHSTLSSGHHLLQHFLVVVPLFVVLTAVIDEEINAS